MKLTVMGREAYAYTGGKPFDPALPCVAFVHGALNDHSVWTLPARWFAHHGHGVLAFDLPGHVRSAGPALKTVEAMADWLLAALDAAGVAGPALLAGHSMGSLVALQAAAQAPARVARLALVGTCVPMPVPQALLDLSLRDPLAAIDRTTVHSFSRLATLPAHSGDGAWLRGAGRALARRVLAAQGDEGLFHTDFAACNGYAGGLEAAAAVRCPATLILGRHDQMTWSKAAGGLAAALRAPVHAVDAGHALLRETPDAVLAGLRQAFG